MVIDIKNIEKDKKFIINLLLKYVLTFRIIIFQHRYKRVIVNLQILHFNFISKFHFS